MSDVERLARLEEQLSGLVRRADSARDEREALADGLTAHDKLCAARWAELKVKMAILMWLASAAVTGVGGLVVRYILDSQS